MASSVDTNCGICGRQNVIKSADHWCPECEDGLCDECQKIHRLSQASSKHVTITIEQYKEITEYISTIRYNCKEHDMKYTNYCPQHDMICCPVCLSTDHKNCVELKTISELIHNSKTSSLFSSLENDLENMETFTDLAVTKQNKNMMSLRQQIGIYADRIVEVRKAINTHLDKIEKNLMSELKDAEDEAMLKKEKVNRELSESSESVNKLKSNLRVLKDYGSDQQAFFGTKKVEVEKDKEARNLERISNDGSLKQTVIKCTINSDVKDILTAITTFGSVSVLEGDQSVVFEENHVKQAHIDIAGEQVDQRSIEDVKLTLLSTIKYPSAMSTIIGCTFCPDGSLIFTDGRKNCLFILDRNGTCVQVTLVTPYPQDVSVIDERSLAVSTSKGIQIISFCNQRIENISTIIANECCGIDYSEGVLFWCKALEGVQKKNLTGGDVITIIPQKELASWFFLSISQNKIYLTNKNTHTVSCFSIDGRILWKFKNKSILEDPFGITVDNNVFVSSYSEIVIISPDGQKSKTITWTKRSNKMCYWNRI